ncbi:MAG: HU family DNA-binding protein [Desulfobacteraceae bacterium]|jgi:integration host factor subunit alpha|nr:MAG: HU family DNA-binding protein [Desulfobacteraceae bacterium]
MTLTKDWIIDALCMEIGLKKSEASKVTESLLEIIKRKLDSGEDIVISGFGKFCVRGMKARKGRNPATSKKP